MIKKHILHWLLPKLLEKKSGDTIPRSGEAGKKVDCYTIHLLDEEGEPYQLVDSLDQDNAKLHVRTIDDNRTFAIEEIVDLNSVSADRLSVNHYYGLYDLNYKNIYDLAFNTLTGWDKLKVKLRIMRDAAFQSYFNRGKLLKKNRIQLLDFMVNHEINGEVSRAGNWTSNSEGFDAWALMSDLHSLRWMNHPQFSAGRRKLDLYLNSLVLSRDLELRNNKYFVTGKALSTLEEYTQKEQRHRDLVKIQKAVLFLTLIMAFAAVVEAKLIDAEDIKGWFSAILHHLESASHYLFSLIGIDIS